MSTSWLRGIVVLIVIFIYFLVGTHGFKEIRPTLYSTVYSRMAEGFANGHLFLPTPVPFELLSLADPYDHNSNWEIITSPDNNIWDLSLYKEKLYAYFGVVPAVVLFLPYRLLTGRDLNDGLAAIIFLSVAYAISAKILYEIKDKFFSQIPEWIILFITLCLGGLNFSSAILKHPFVYEVAISAAMAFGFASILYLLRLVRDANLNYGNIFLASLYAGFAFGCRPIYVAYLFLLSFIFLYKLFFIWGTISKIKPSLVFAIPLVCIVSALFYYNYLRFDDFFDYGWNYQLNGYNAHELRPLALNRIPAGLYYFLLHPLALVNKFPYFEFMRRVPTWLNIPQEFLPEASAGFLITVSYFTLALPFCFIWPVVRSTKYRLPSLETLIIFLTGIMLMSLISMHVSSVIRYHCDVATYYVLAASLIWFSVDQTLISKNGLRIFVRSLYLFLATVSTYVVLVIGYLS